MSPHPPQADPDSKTLYWTTSDPSLAGLNDSPSNDSSRYPNNLFSTPTAPPEGLMSSSEFFIPPTVPGYQHEEQGSADPGTDDPMKRTKNLPQATQWASLRELCWSSRLQYIKFLCLTAKYESRGIKKLRKLYGSARGMLDTGIMTFRDVLDGQEPKSLKEVFAFTCLSYVMSKILQKHGRIAGSHVLADTGRWRWAMKKEKDRLTYDEVVKIIWPEIEFLATHSKATDDSSASTLPELRRDCMVATNLSFDSDSIGPVYVPLSMMAYGMAALPERDFIERARTISCSYFASNMQPALNGQNNDLGPVNQDSHYGLQDHVIEMLQETSSHDAFMFTDFLNLDSLPWGSNSSVHVKQSRDTMSAAQPPGPSPQTCQPIGPIETINPKQLSASYAQPENDHMESLVNPIINPKPLVREEPLLSESVHSSLLPSFLKNLADTVMFQIVVEFAKCKCLPCLPFSLWLINIAVSSLSDLQYRLPGCGITTRHKEHEVEDYSRPVHDFGEFVNGASKLVFEPIKDALGEIDGPFVTVLCMAETFVRLGRLQTVREIDEYIIKTSRVSSRNQFP